MLLPKILKVCWKGFTILCLIALILMVLYLIFCGHKGVDSNAYDKAMMFFMGVSLSGIMTFSKALYTTSKQTDFVKSILDLKKKQNKIEQALTPTEPKVEKTEDGKTESN